jgi:thiol:disulfide interchange protein DsbD
MSLSGSPLDYIVAFFGGVLVSFTPCVYPLIPVSIGYIGAKSDSRFKGFLLSLVYVTGIALTYSALGLIASLTGKIFGSISSHPITYLLVGIIIVVFSLSMLGVFHLYIYKPKLPVFKKRGYLSVLFLGIVSGFIVSPCLTPVLGSIFSYLVTKKDMLYGMSLLAVFAYGMGAILILSGTFAGLLINLPKSGKWMEDSKKFAGVLLLLTGAYFIYNGIRRF